jgi:hypothetical protein
MNTDKNRWDGRRAERRAFPSVFTCVHLWLITLVVLTACKQQRTTRMTGDDFDHMAAEMAQSLAADPDIAGRTPDSPPWVVSIQKVQNLSSDVMSEGEQWGTIARIRGAQPIQRLRQTKNLAFVIPAEQTRKLREQGDLGPNAQDFGSDRRPTHVMTATFRSATRMVREARTEYYFCEFEVLDLATGEPVWTDKIEYKRAAAGHVWD